MNLSYQIIKLDDLSYEDLMMFSGVCDDNIKTLEILHDLSIIMRDGELKVFTEDLDKFNLLKHHVNTIINMLKNKQNIDKDVISHSFTAVKNNHKEEYDNFNKKIIAYNHNNQAIRVKTYGQAKLIDSIKNNDIVFASGPAGTGKTYLAVVMAVNALKSGEVSKIVLTRPAVEAGESLGFLPGDLKEKVDPYLMPLYDALDDLIGHEKVELFLERNVIEIIPLAYMRGRTLNDAFIILDEAQNTTGSQMLMFLTRLGMHSKMVVTGDITQIDLNIKKASSGLLEASRILKDIKGIDVVELTRHDVVRNPLVQAIIDKYAK